MKKVVRLTESDLVRLVKRVIKEQKSMDPVNTPNQNISSAASNDITAFFDRTGNGGCKLPFTIINGNPYCKIQDVKIKKSPKGTWYIGYKLPEQKTQTSFGPEYTGGNIDNCPFDINVLGEFGKKWFRTLQNNPGRPYSVVFKI